MKARQQDGGLFFSESRRATEEKRRCAGFFLWTQHIGLALLPLHSLYALTTIIAG